MTTQHTIRDLLAEAPTEPPAAPDTEPGQAQHTPHLTRRAEAINKLAGEYGPAIAPHVYEAVCRTDLDARTDLRSLALAILDQAGVKRCNLERISAEADVEPRWLFPEVDEDQCPKCDGDTHCILCHGRAGR
jgi:hypothetical protein